MKKGVKLLLFTIFLISCNSGKLSKSETVAETETIIIARITILNSGKDITKNAKVYFDENIKGIFSYRLKEDGLMIMKMPKGNHFLKHIYTAYGSANLPDGYAQISVPETGKVYYIGNIEIDGNTQLQKKFSGIVRDVQAKDLKEVRLPVRVVDKRDDVVEAYEKEFGNDKTIVISLMEVQ